MNTITLPNGRTAVCFVPEDSKELGIVHISTIKRLAKLLHHAPVHVIIKELKDELTGCDIPMACEICEEFSSFHRTVNLIEKYQPMTEEEKSALIGNDIGAGIKEANEMIDADLNRS